MSALLGSLRHPRFSLDHRYTVRRAAALAGGEARPAAARRMQRHIAVCPMCAELVAGLRRTVAGLRTLGGRTPDGEPATPAEQAIVDDVLSALRRERSDSGPPPDSS